MKKYYLFAGLVLLAASPAFAQVKIGAPGAPDGSAMLEVTSGASNNKGMLLPRMTTVQRNAITSPATGLMIYNTTANQVQVNTGTPAAPTWVTATATATGWNITGNTGTSPAINFIGTTDNQPLVVRTNNTEKARVTADGDVGIGTTAPSAKLHVVDTGNASIIVGSTTTSASGVYLGNSHHGMYRNLNNAGGGANDVALITTSGSPSNPASIHLGVKANVADTLDLDQFVLKNTGNVGIGTKDPAARLHVDSGGFRVSNGATALLRPAIEVINDGAGPGPNDNIVISSYGTSTQPSIGTQSARGTASAPQNSQFGDNIGNFFFNSRVNGGIANSNVIRGVYLGDGTTNKSRLSILTSNTVAMTIDSNQNVGINTASPQQPLHVAGAARITGSAGTATTIAGRNAAGDVSNVTVGAGLSLTGGTLTATGGGTNDWDLTGNAGTNPATNFIGTSDNQPMVVRTNNTEKVRVTAAGNVGIGTNAPAEKLHVVDTGDVAIRVASSNGGESGIQLGNPNHGIIRDLTASGGGANDVAVYTSTGAGGADLHLIANPIASGSNSLPLNQFVLKNTGDIGIGTNTPASKLQVEGGSLIVSNSAPTTRSAASFINDGGGSGQVDDVDIFSYGTAAIPAYGMWTARGTAAAPANAQTGDVAGALRFGTRVNGSIAEINRVQSVYLGDGTTLKSRLTFTTNGVVGNTAMSIDSSGDVGIGVLTPLQTLHVAGTARITAATGTPTTITGRNAAGDVGNVTVGTGLTLTAGTLSVTGGTNDWDLTGNTGTNPATNFIGTSDNQPLVVRTNNTEKVRVTAAGDMGIGTGAPAQTLHVAGTARISTAAGTPTTITGRNAAGDVGNVTVGTGLTLTAGTLSVTGGTNDWDLTGNAGTNPATNFIGTSDNQPLVFRTNSTEKIRLTTAGYVGIGFANPNAKLHVNGGVMVSRDTNLTYGNGGMTLWSSVRSGIGEMEFINFHGTGSGGFRFYDVDPDPIVGTADTGSWIAYIQPGTGTYHTPSDGRVKTNVNVINEGLAKVMAMRPVSYDLHTGRELKDGVATFTKNDKTISTIGFIAQELVKIVPEAVNVPSDPNTELYSVSYTTVIPVLTKAIQEQQQIIETLKAELASVKTDNAALKADASKIAELAEKMKQLEAILGTTTGNVTAAK